MVAIRRIRIEGFRSIDTLDLPLDGLTVLIGQNGAGKSTILEALEILRRTVASGREFLNEFSQIHGALFSTLRRRAPHLRLGVDVEGGAGLVSYDLWLQDQGGYPIIARERLGGPDYEVFERNGAALAPANIHLPSPRDLLISGVAFAADERVRMVTEALSGIEYHFPFQVTAAWGMRAAGMPTPARAPEQIRRTERLQRFGGNLANAYHTMLTEDGPTEWAKTMDLVRLGLGDHFVDIRTRTIQDGFVAMRFRLRGVDEDVGEAELSDGQLAYLGFVALFRLRRRELGRTTRTLLVFDEPETHLHPATLGRVVGFLEQEAREHPVIVATHADALLDSLERPEESVRVCELDEAALATRVRSLERDALRQWLGDYRGLGVLRANGYLPEVVAR